MLSQVSDLRPSYLCSSGAWQIDKMTTSSVLLQLVWSGKMLIARVNGCETDAVISYLPLSHIAAQLLDIYGPFSCGASVYFAQPDALKVRAILSSLTYHHAMHLYFIQYCHSHFTENYWRVNLLTYYFKVSSIKILILRMLWNHAVVVVV